MIKKSLVLLILFSALIFVSRIIPHWPNFVPVTAVALSAGVYLGKKWAIILPLVGLFVSDLILGLYAWPIMLSVYGSFASIGLLSWWLRKNKNVVNAVSIAMLSSVIFFLITNFAVWAFSPWYAKDLAGLEYCFTLALPFFRTTLTGDLFYTGILFSAFELAVNWERIGVKLGLKSYKVAKS